ncbi:tRNA (adenosine(37)-N6)-threonylcarbamoyltransferase complex dimerization subunit type 1 TsaB [Candidatus Saccharibacteria bacterium]|nr:tRNA (adenosine(37)-N6)-threonylcarbamoyltransferase complex dimerization subunit type 1 TsaB [Candidatus Saccharibacteria bacterium]
MILTIRTDKPEAEIGLFDDNKKLDYLIWEAHRNLSTDIHKKIKEILEKNNKSYKELRGIALYSGPGSFTGLRIGAAVANTMTDALNISIVGGGGLDWIETSIDKIQSGSSDKIVVPNYGASANTTKPKK